VRHRNPDWDDEQVRLEVIRLWLGDELFKEVYGSRQKDGRPEDAE
jgi:hypothetical protein